MRWEEGRLKRQSTCFNVSERLVLFHLCHNLLVCVGSSLGTGVNGVCAFACVCACVR